MNKIVKKVVKLYKHGKEIYEICQIMDLSMKTVESIVDNEVPVSGRYGVYPDKWFRYKYSWEK